MNVSLDILDIQERAISIAKPPSFPTPPTSGASGFPQPKKRSRFAAQRQQTQKQSSASRSAPGHSTQTASAAAAAAAVPRAIPDSTRSVAPGSRYSPAGDSEEKRQIDAENNARLAAMSPGDIAAAQKEIFESFNPALLQILLRRANLDEPQSGPSPFDTAPGSAANGEPTVPLKEAAPEIKVDDIQRTLQPSPPPPLKTSERPKTDALKNKSVTFDTDSAVPIPRADLPSDLSGDAATTPLDGHEHDHEREHGHLLTAAGSTHFPQAPRIPDLDPADPDFLANMHSKYFPDMPVDPSRLAWMAPVPTPGSIADRDSPYYPGRSSLGVPQIRFDFSGRILSPRAARQVPVTSGLHHHGEAPEAAGYTIPELARLARSSFPAQRCIAFQTLGRMLYRLGRGEWGIGLGLDDQDLAQPLWQCFREIKVLESLVEAAGVPDGVGHRSCKVYATEALWLYEQGGWREKLRA